jgi:hypothetical protein
MQNCRDRWIHSRRIPPTHLINRSRHDDFPWDGRPPGEDFRSFREVADTGCLSRRCCGFDPGEEGGIVSFVYRESDFFVIPHADG